MLIFRFILLQIQNKAALRPGLAQTLNRPYTGPHYSFISSFPPVTNILCAIKWSFLARNVQMQIKQHHDERIKTIPIVVQSSCEKGKLTTAQKKGKILIQLSPLHTLTRQ